MKCSVCDNEARARGYCPKHYQRWKKTGSPDDSEHTHAPLIDRLWRRIDKRGPHDCWPWTGGMVRGGYGSVQVGGKGSKGGVAHRELYKILNGPIPDGLVVMHRCDNPPCCNPLHLKLGTPKDNTLDMMAKGRRVSCSPVGEANGKSKLTKEKVLYIRANADKGYGQLAAEMGLDYTTVLNAGKRRSWKHIK